LAGVFVVGVLGQRRVRRRALSSFTPTTCAPALCLRASGAAATHPVSLNTLPSPRRKLSSPRRKLSSPRRKRPTPRGKLPPPHRKLVRWRRKLRCPCRKLRRDTGSSAAEFSRSFGLFCSVGPRASWAHAA
jgi:hypothetical protein